MDRILIVEDDNNINQMVYEMFNKCGYKCTSAFSGTEALLRMENSKAKRSNLNRSGMNSKKEN